MLNQLKPPTPLVGSDRYFYKEKPLEFVKGKGFKVLDQHGNSYIDFACGMGPVILGHAHPEFTNKLAKSLKDGLSFPGFAQIHQLLANHYEIAQPNKKVISLFKTSSEAVTAAFRFSMMSTKRKQIIRCGFLGWHDAQIYNTPSWHEALTSSKRKKLRYLEGFRGISHNETVHNWEDLNIDTLKTILKVYGDQISAFAIDIYQLAFMDLSTFSQAISLCRSMGIQIIYDETKTAGRTNPAAYLHLFPIQPDYYILGKAIANGMPLAVLLGDESKLHIYQDARVGGTHTKEVLSPSAALITMDIMKKQNGYKRLGLIGKKVCSAFNSAAEFAGVSDRIKAESLFEGTLFDLRYSSELVNKTEKRERLKNILFENRIILLEGHCSFINLAHEELNFDYLTETFIKSFHQWNLEIAQYE